MQSSILLCVLVRVFLSVFEQSQVTYLWKGFLNSETACEVATVTQVCH